jgi:HD-like signal output (HDOD) protein
MKKLVYVVDDQPSVLQTAVLILQTIDPDWKVVGFSHPAEALAAVKAAAPDMVLSDQVMPQMQGSQLLEEVRKVSPNTVRIIMSGHVAFNQLSVITSAHQYIAKPFEAGTLKALVLRTLAAQERMREDGLQGVVTSLRSLPSLPQVHHSLLAELEDSRGPGAVIARLVAEDAGLSSKVLQLANSPLFGRGYLIVNPIEAVLCLGTEMIKAIVLTQALFKHYAVLKDPDVDLPRVWSHCWEVAQLAQHFCLKKRLSASQGEEAFLAGLLHELGRFILVDSFPEQFRAACQAARATQSPLTPHLLDTFNTTPFRITAYLLELWGMPDRVISAVSFLHQPEQQHPGDFSVTTALYIADQIASRKSPPDSFAVPEWNTTYLQAVGCMEDVAAWEKDAGVKRGA